jgi:hypothetical protein
MFEQLSEAIDDLSIPLDGRALTQALMLADRLAAKVAAVVGQFDRHGLWDLDGATSMRAWLRDAGLTSSDASRLTDTGRKVNALPVLTAAWQRGEVSGGQVQAVVRNVPDRHLELFADHETEVVPALVGLSVTDTARAMNEWSARADALHEQPEPSESPQSFHLSQTLEGKWVADGSFNAEGGALLAKAIDLAESKDYDVPVAQRRAEALVDIAAYFLDNQHQHAGGRHRPHLNVIVDANHLHGGGRGELVDQQLPLDRATTARLLCDCAMHRVVVDRSERGRMTILEVAAATRTIPAGLWSALVIRDRHCRYPGCDRPPTWCEGHHVQWISQNGKTKLDNLVLLCRRHHRLLHHRPGVVAKLEPDGVLHVTYDDGTQRTTHPPPPPP